MVREYLVGQLTRVELASLLFFLLFSTRSTQRQWHTHISCSKLSKCPAARKSRKWNFLAKAVRPRGSAAMRDKRVCSLLRDLPVPVVHTAKVEL